MVRVNTNEFEFSHGEKPRGFGQWAFFMEDASVFWFNGAYGAAVKAAKAEAKRKGFYEVKVGA